MSEFIRDGPLLKQLKVLIGLSEQHRTHVELAKLAGVSPAMVNAYLATLRERGFVVRVGRSRRSTAYSLTREGMRYRDTLLVDYNADLIRMYASARSQIGDRIREVLPSGQLRICLCPAGDTASVVLSVLSDFRQVSVVGVFDDDKRKHGHTLGGHSIHPLEDLDDQHCDGILIATIAYGEAIAQRIAQVLKRPTAVWRLY